MAQRIRVILADDSAVIRRLLSDALREDPEIEAIAVAKNGSEAVGLACAHAADVALLDVEMPVMDGVQATREILAVNPRLPIILFSSATPKGAAATLDGLDAGAADFVMKPMNVGHLTAALAQIRKDVLPKIKFWSRQQRGGRGPILVASAEPRRADRGTVEVVVIGCSTGGGAAVAEILKHLPLDFSVPIIVSQDMPELYSRLLAERLRRVCPLHVSPAKDGAVLGEGTVWIAPGDTICEIVEFRGHHILKVDPPSSPGAKGLRVDALLTSAARVHGTGSLAVILTGNGTDGLAGSLEIRGRGGKVLAQDAASSLIWEMPRAVSEAGLAHEVLPLDRIGPRIAALASSGFRSATGFPPTGPAKTDLPQGKPLPTDVDVPYGTSLPVPS